MNSPIPVSIQCPVNAAQLAVNEAAISMEWDGEYLLQTEIEIQMDSNMRDAFSFQLVLFRQFECSIIDTFVFGLGV